MQRYNLFMESRYRFSTTSMYSTPPSSPDYSSTLKKPRSGLPSSPLLSHGLMESPCTGEDPDMVEKMVEPEVMVAQQVEAQEHAHLELTEVSTAVKADDEHKVEDNEVLEVPVNAVIEIQARSTTPETQQQHAAVEEETHVAIQSSEEKMYSGLPDVVAINTDPSSSSATESVLKLASHTSAELVPKAVETEASETPVQASPPERDTGSQSETSGLKFVSESETVVVGDDVTSLRAPIYEDRVSNVTQDFSDGSSWTTEEEGDSIDEDDLPMETTPAVPKPEDSVIVKCETLSDLNANVPNISVDLNSEAARPLGCIKEIRDLVVEVIEVEEVVQHYPDHEEVNLNTP